MKISIISDTHIPSAAGKLPDKLIQGLKRSDLIIHAGDFTESDILEELKKIAPIEAVCGNMDSPKLKQTLPEKIELNIKGFKIGVIHGNGAPSEVLNYVISVFKQGNFNCIIYGHSHSAAINNIDSVLYINPGSPTDKVFAEFNSYVEININEKIEAKIVKL